MLTSTVNFAENQTNTYLASREGGRGSFSNVAVNVNTLGRGRIWWTSCQRSAPAGRFFCTVGVAHTGVDYNFVAAAVAVKEEVVWWTICQCRWEFFSRVLTTVLLTPNLLRPSSLA